MLIRLYAEPVPNDGSAVPLCSVPSPEEDGHDGNLAAFVRRLMAFYCLDNSKRYLIQVWDDDRQAWYYPSSRTWATDGDGLIPCELVAMVGSWRI